LSRQQIRNFVEEWCEAIAKAAEEQQEPVPVYLIDRKQSRLDQALLKMHGEPPPLPLMPPPSPPDIGLSSESVSGSESMSSYESGSEYSILSYILFSYILYSPIFYTLLYSILSHILRPGFGVLAGCGSRAIPCGRYGAL
jgi:hypothetical protein